MSAYLVEVTPRIWNTIAQLPKENTRVAEGISCMHKVRNIRYKTPSTFHVVEGLIMRLIFFTEDPDRVRDTVVIFLFSNLSLSTTSEVEMVERIGDTVFY